MQESSWNKFKEAKEGFAELTERLSEDLSKSMPKLKGLLQEFTSIPKRKYYVVETPIVYSKDLDDFKKPTDIDRIKLILVADNPGQKEQKEGRYLIGPDGTKAENFFTLYPIYGIEDFRKDVLILNKTPLHTARTGDLESLRKKHSSFDNALTYSQKEMASLLMKFQKARNVPVWIIGTSEMAKGKVFDAFTKELHDSWETNSALFEKVFLFRHFSNDWFMSDFAELQDKCQCKPLEGIQLEEKLHGLGTMFRSWHIENYPKKPLKKPKYKRKPID